MKDFSGNRTPQLFPLPTCGGCGGLWRLWRGLSEINSKILVFNKLWKMWRVVEAMEGLIRKISQDFSF